MVSLQRNWFPAMKVNCYDMILMLHVLPWIEYYKVLQQLTMGQKAKPDFVARMGSFDDAECFDAFVRMRMHQAWSSAMILLMGWKLTNDQPWTCRRSTPSCRGIGWGYQGPWPTAWKMDYPDFTMKLSTKSYKAYLRPRETIKHPPIQCPKWPRSGSSIVSRRKISYICFQMNHTRVSFKK